jgi:hypothetical protein
VFVVDEPAYVVFCGVGSGPFFTVLFDAEADVVGESYVETAGTTGEDVNVEMVFALWHSERIAEESVVEKQIPPLRCGMTNKRAKARTRTKADSSAALRNDKQKGNQG